MPPSPEWRAKNVDTENGLLPLEVSNDLLLQISGSLLWAMKGYYNH